MQKIVLIDPLTFLGRELRPLLAEDAGLPAELVFLHCPGEDEHQIVELGGEATLVQPLRGPEDLEDAGLVVLASEEDSPCLDHLEEVLERHPEIALLDLSNLPRLRERTIPTAGPPTGVVGGAHLRLAHPALVAAAAVVRPLRHLGVVALSIGAQSPVSALGRNAVETLARQAAQRLQGVDVDERVAGEIRAFNQVSVASDLVTADAAAVLPGIDTVVTLTDSGSFHGHLAHVGIACADQVDEQEIVEALAADSMLSLEPQPLHLDRVVDRDQVVVSPPILSPSRRQVAVTAMVDGLRVGGVLTALQVIRTLL